MNNLKRSTILALIVVAIVVSFIAGTMMASAGPTTGPEAPAALTAGQQVAVWTSDWLMTSRVMNDVFMPLTVRQ